MGNNTSNKPGGTDVAGGAYSPTSRDENVYDQSFPPGPPAPASRRFSASSQSSPYAAVSRVSPPLPPRGIERRSQTVVARHPDRDSSVGSCNAYTMYHVVLYVHLYYYVAPTYKQILSASLHLHV